MYTTKPLSQLLNSPQSVLARPEGPNSGFLVIQDEESETYSYFGLCKNRTLNDLPFPQNKELTVRYAEYEHPVYMIPVLNQPLSSNLYYAIQPHGKRIGEAFTCSTEEDKATCCFCRCVKEVKPRPLDPSNIYQQFQIVPYESLCAVRGDFFAKSAVEDGFPPYFIRQKGWTIDTTATGNLMLIEARGLNSTLRARFPELTTKSSGVPVVVGRWYCSFMFVKEGTLIDQVKKSMYYRMTLEQRWEKVYSYRRNYKENSVVIDVVLEKEVVLIEGNKADWDDKNVVDGVIWFTSSPGENKRVGLRREIVERMKWEQERGGMEVGGEREVKINRVEEFKGDVKAWSELRCYVLVEGFTLKRMDESLVMAYDFKHYHQVKIIWE